MNRIIVWFLSLVAIIALAIIIVPEFINLSYLKTKIELAILNQTGQKITINGNVRLSLLGRTTISAYDVSIDNYGTKNHIDYAQFSVPLLKIFNLGSAKIPDKITVSGAYIEISDLVPPKFNNTIVIKNSAISFMGKTYNDINGTLENGMFVGYVRTTSHKYTFEVLAEKFVIKNDAVNLILTGTLASDEFGNTSASGTLAIDTDEINKWFEFSAPQIDKRISMTMKYEWSGTDFRFYDISGTMDSGSFNGEINLHGTKKIIKLTANNIDFDMSFLMEKPDFLNNSEFDVEMSGKIKFMDHIFNNIMFSSKSESGDININRFGFSSPILSGSIGGIISSDGAILAINVTKSGTNFQCNFSGDPDKWSCSDLIINSSEFSGTGTLNVSPMDYKLSVMSDDLLPNFSYLKTLREFFGARHGNISFDIPNAAGVIDTDNNKYIMNYTSENVSLETLPVKFNTLLPETMLKEIGTLSAIISDDEIQELVFTTPDWEYSSDKSLFVITHNNWIELFKNFQPGIESKFLKNGIPILITGNYKKPYISDLKITLGDMLFTGLVNGDSVTLKTGLLDIDSLINTGFIIDYDTQKFLTPEPLIVPFSLPFSLTLSADIIKYDNNEYANFVYLLKNNSQKMSITDENRGHILLAIDRDKVLYKMIVQINNFVFRGGVLNESSPLNISDSVLTARADFSTTGITANDFWENLNGELDITFDGGIFHGIGIDKFYSHAKNISRLNVGDMVATMLDSGDTKLKSLHISGIYKDGEFASRAPFTMRASHSEISGNIVTNENKLSANLSIMLRGIAPYPEKISVDIFPDDSRDYSLFEISSKIDPDFLYNFISSHDKF